MCALGFQAGGVCTLELSPHTLAIFEQQQVQLRALVRGPKVGLVWLGNRQRLFER